MADHTKPNRAANMEKAEGDRSPAEENLRSQEPTADRDDKRGSEPEGEADDGDWPVERSER